MHVRQGCKASTRYSHFLSTFNRVFLFYGSKGTFFTNLYIPCGIYIAKQLTIVYCEGPGGKGPQSVGTEENTH